MAFVDDLGFVVVLILAGASVLAWTSIRGFLAMYRNNPTQLRSILKSSAVPAGIIGVIAAAMGLDIEAFWPFPASIGLGSYNIFFGDALMLFAMVMIVYAIVAWFKLKLEYAGLFAFIAGITTAWYGYWGYTTLVKPGVLGLTKDPLETFLMYGAFAAAGFFALPAAMAVDWFLEHPGPDLDEDLDEHAAREGHPAGGHDGDPLPSPLVRLCADRLVPNLCDPGGHRGVALHRRHSARTPDERALRVRGKPGNPDPEPTVKRRRSGDPTHSRVLHSASDADWNGERQPLHRGASSRA